MGISVGLVSPKKSKWRRTQSFAVLQEQLAFLAEDSDVLVCDENLVTLEEIPYRHVLARPFLVSLRLYQIRRYRKMSRREAALLAAKELLSELSRGLSRRAHLWLLRNRNITAAHQYLWERAEGDWIAIFEDDLEITSDDFVNECRRITEKANSLKDQPANLALFISSSFTPEVQGLSPDLMKALNTGKTTLLWVPWVGFADTTAGTIYSRHFLEDLSTFLGQKTQLELNTLPIDWLVDDFFRTHSPQEMLSILCEPGLCRQSSLH